MTSVRSLAFRVACGVVIGSILSGVTVVAISSFTQPVGAQTIEALSTVPAAPSVRAVSTDKAQQELSRYEASRKKLAANFARLQPQGTWVLIDSGANRIYLMDGEKVVLNAVCSTGKGTPLEDPQTGRKWIFNTPRGEFEIRTKKIDPIWIKPDWAFVEEGQPIPKGFKDRVEPDMLGDYAMDIGDGYLIHGTLYKRALGMSVTHGCVRVGDEDLETIYKAVKIGTRVYII